MVFFSKIVMEVKKRLFYKPDAERVDIRLLSIPDWLYKITSKDQKDLSILCKQNLSDFKAVITELNSCIEKIEIKKQMPLDVSRYKQDLVATNKEIYVEKLREFCNLSNKDLQSLEDYRYFFGDLFEKYSTLRKSISKSSNILTEFYSKEIMACDSCFDRINDLLLKFRDIFSKNNDSRVNSIVKIVREIEGKLETRKTFDLEITALDKEISKVRSHIYKLSDKLDLLKQSPRFKDVLEKEGRLGQLLESKEDLISTMEKKFVPIEVVLYSYADKVRENALAKEYVTHFSQAICHDEELQILELLSGLNSDLLNNRTKLRKSLGDVKADQLSEQVVWLLENFKQIKKEIFDLTLEIKHFRSAMRNYVIFNEIEDHESRVEFYQNKLKEFLIKRKEKIIEIENLNLVSLKEKLHRDLLLVSGYDVLVIYDED